MDSDEDEREGESERERERKRERDRDRDRELEGEAIMTDSAVSGISLMSLILILDLSPIIVST
jgi:hypothetical protein